MRKAVKPWSKLVGAIQHGIDVTWCIMMGHNWYRYAKHGEIRGWCLRCGETMPSAKIRKERI